MSKLTQADMKLDHCEECGCGGEMFIASRCHPGGGTTAVLHHDLLCLECSVCQKPICYFTIAGGPYGAKPQ